LHRYKVEYLRAMTDEDSVLSTLLLPEHSLEETRRLASAHLGAIPGATGFQVRDMNDGAKIVPLEKPKPERRKIADIIATWLQRNKNA
jgi:hypothetical protein